LKGVRCGVLICYDYSFPELYREYKRRGVQLMFHSYHAGHGSPKDVQSWRRPIGVKNCRLNRGCSHAEIRIPPAMTASATSNYVWISCSNTSAPESCFPSFFVRADGIVTGRLRKNIPGILISTVDTTEVLYDGTEHWRNRAMRGIFHSGDLVRDARSDNRTQV
jgi:deaminated glutathione amidase